MIAPTSRLHREDLICAHFTLGGLEGAVDLETRAAAVAAAGFAHLGWLGDGYRSERQAGRSDADIQAILAHYDVRVAEIEFLFGWSSVEPGFDWQEQEENLLRLADVVGADHLNCGDVGLTGPMLPIDQVAERFAGICDRAGEHGLRAAIEFLPWSEIPDAATAWEIVRRAGRSNGGILIDAWHQFRGPGSLDQIRAIPPEHVVVIQLDDADPPQGDAADDTSHRRRLPGQGEFDLVGLIRLLDDLGVDAPLSVEILNDDFSALEPKEAARQAHAATMSVLESARGVAPPAG
jgi:sugar phosphate isomerase/epimerase